MNILVATIMASTLVGVKGRSSLNQIVLNNALIWFYSLINCIFDQVIVVLLLLMQA